MTMLHSRWRLPAQDPHRILHGRAVRFEVLKKWETTLTTCRLTRQSSMPKARKTGSVGEILQEMHS